MYDCTTDSYASLYARWLEKPGDLLDFGGYDPEQHNLLDLCGGTGAVACAAKARGGAAALLDLNPRCDDPTVFTIKGRAEDLDVLSRGRSWNFIACRQALGYLSLYETAKALYDVTTPGAIFVCNNFLRPKWSFRPYRFKGRWFLEASGFLGQTVFHLQAAPTDYDITIFSWYTPEQVEMAFEPCWTLERREVSQKSVRFRFTRNP